MGENLLKINLLVWRWWFWLHCGWRRRRSHPIRYCLRWRCFVSIGCKCSKLLFRFRQCSRIWENSNPNRISHFEFIFKFESRTKSEPNLERRTHVRIWNSNLRISKRRFESKIQKLQFRIDASEFEDSTALGPTQYYFIILVKYTIITINLRINDWITLWRMIPKFPNFGPKSSELFHNWRLPFARMPRIGGPTSIKWINSCNQSKLISYKLNHFYLKLKKKSLIPLNELKLANDTSINSYQLYWVSVPTPKSKHFTKSLHYYQYQYFGFLLW